MDGRKQTPYNVWAIFLVSCVLCVSRGHLIAADGGIQKLSGQRLTLYTDLDGKEIDGLPELFEQEFLQLCNYFHISPNKLPDWSMTGFLMKDKSKFVRSGQLPGDLPKFENGYSRGHDLWLYEQPSDYYRRHLLLHEGVHGYMHTILGECGPTWYAEGMAEMLSTHKLKDGRLTLNYMPENREDVPEWGRIKLIKDAVADGRMQPIGSVIEGPQNIKKETELYAWSWAAVYFFDHHPNYLNRFKELYKRLRDPNFNRHVFDVFRIDWLQLNVEWEIFINDLEYGYDISRTAIDFAKGKPLPEKGATLTIASDRGWQNSGIQLQAGKKYKLSASGRYKLADKPKTWWCEPGGVSIRYYQGRPLGLLLAAVYSENPSNSRPRAGNEKVFTSSQAEPGNEGMKSNVFIHPIIAGLEATIAPEQSGTLYFKINDSPAELSDNSGDIKINVDTL